MANIPYIDYNKLEEFYTISALCELFQMEKAELRKKCDQYHIQPRRNEIGENGFLSMTSGNCIICCIMRTTMDIPRALQRMMIRGHDRYPYRQGSSATAQDNTPAASKDDCRRRTSCC